MLYLTCTTITDVDLAHYGESRAKDRVSVGCGTSMFIILIGNRNYIHLYTGDFSFHLKTPGFSSLNSSLRTYRRNASPSFA